jgi:Cytochrome c7 and related cytochrome c
MAQIFHRSTNTISRVSIYGALILAVGLVFLLYAFAGSPYVTDVDEAKVQPVPFSHQHHAAELGIDCRYCHTSVEISSDAGMPATKTCMTCHSQIWVGSPMLEPVRASYRQDQAIEWSRVNAVPDFVYFNHSIHVNKGVGCTTCHGPLGDMPITWRANSLLMGWCLDCHRAPENYVRPRSQVFSVSYQPPPNQQKLGRQLIQEYKIQGVLNLTNCTTCHR